MRSQWMRTFLRVCIAALIAAAVSQAGPLTFNVAFDSSVGSAPAGFVSAFNTAIGIYQSLYNNPITINMNVGWGEIDGNPLNPSDLGQSRTNQQGFFTYSQVKSAMVSNATSANALAAVATLPATDPTSGANFVMSNAEAKAFGLLSGSAAGIDGWVGFDSAASWTFDPANRAVAGEDDFIGVALHEIAEVMGRYGMGQNGAASGRYSPIDLYRWTSAGVRDLSPENGDYFSINNGATNINTYNGTGGGDLSDWSGLTTDAYNAFLSPNTKYDLSSGDVELMNVLGYQLAQTAAPEPSNIAILASGLGLLLFYRQRVRSRNRPKK